MRYRFIREESQNYPVKVLCRVMKVSRSGYYHWCQYGETNVICFERLQLIAAIKQLFKESRQSLGSRGLKKALKKYYEIKVSRGTVIKLMRELGLVCQQRRAHKVTTNSKHSNAIADNLLNQVFDVSEPNTAWAGDITYLRTREGWLYLAVVIDLYSRKVIGYAMDKQMTQELVIRALKQAMLLRKPKLGQCLFHSDRGSQYSSKAFRKVLERYGITSSMSGKGACLDNAVVERFFGSLKHEWLNNVIHFERQGMKSDVDDYIRYYNHRRLHSSLGDMSPVEYELSDGVAEDNLTEKVSDFG